MNFCPQCRSPLEPNARFCANCGNTLGGQPQAPGAGPRPFAGPAPYGGTPPAGPSGYGPPAGPPGYGPPAAGPPGYGPPGSPYGGPPGGPPMGAGMGPMPYGPPMPPPGDGGGGGMKVLGGCGVAGCLGIVVAVGLVMVFVFVFAFSGGGGGSSSSGSSGEGPGSGDVPTSGSVRDLVRQNIGPYRLAGTSPLEKVPSGVVDNVGAVYTAPDGTKVMHILLVYPTESMAAQAVENVWSSSVGTLKPGEKIGRSNLTDKQGGVHGTILRITGGNPEQIFWNNRKLVCVITAPRPHATGFESNVPY